MWLLASGDDAAKILIVVIGVVVFLAYVIWKVLAVAKAVKTKGTQEQKNKAMGNALGGGGAYGKGYDVGTKAGEKLGSLFKPKSK